MAICKGLFAEILNKNKASGLFDTLLILLPTHQPASGFGLEQTFTFGKQFTPKWILYIG